MHDTLGSFTSEISKYTATGIVIPPVLHTAPGDWVWGGALPPFQLVPKRLTFRQNFSNLPKTL